MFSNEPRRIFGKNPILEVICQLRFPEILAIGARPPVDFQEAIRGEYPQYQAMKEVAQPKVTGTPGNFQLQEAAPTINYQFRTQDGAWRINLTTKFISLSCAKYDRWEEFARRLDQMLAAFIQVYAPAYFDRVGLRFINAVCRSELDLEGVPFRELFQAPYLGLLAQETVNEKATNRSSVDTELTIQGGCRAKIHAGPGMVRRPGMRNPEEVRFILDNDLFMSGNVPVNLSAAALNTLHGQADSLFRGAITDTLFDAMEPMEP